MAISAAPGQVSSLCMCPLCLEAVLAEGPRELSRPASAGESGSFVWPGVLPQEVRSHKSWVGPRLHGWEWEHGQVMQVHLAEIWERPGWGVLGYCPCAGHILVVLLCDCPWERGSNPPLRPCINSAH